MFINVGSEAFLGQWAHSCAMDRDQLHVPSVSHCFTLAPCRLLQLSPRSPQPSKSLHPTESTWRLRSDAICFTVVGQANAQEGRWQPAKPQLVEPNPNAPRFFSGLQAYSILHGAMLTLKASHHDACGQEKNGQAWRGS